MDRNLRIQRRTIRESIARQEQAQRRAIETTAREAGDILRRRHGEVERLVQAGIGEVRKAEAMEQRKLDLPIAQPRDIRATERIAEMERLGREATAEVGEAKARLEKAKLKDIAAVEEATKAAQAELDKAYEEALAEQRKAKREYERALKEYEEARTKAARLEDFITNGKLDLTAAVTAGFTKLEDYAGFDIKASDIDKILEYTSKTKETRLRLKDFIEDDKLDLTAAVAAGFIKVEDYFGWDVKQSDIDEALTPTDVQQVFKRLQSEGKISIEAKLVSTQAEFEKTSELEYQLPALLDVSRLEKEFLAEPRLGRRNIIDAALGRYTSLIGPIVVMPPRLEYKNLTSEEQEKILHYYSTLTGKEKVLGVTISKWMEPSIGTIKGIVGMVPVVGTVALWDEMTPTWKGISIALDVLILAPFARAGVLALQKLRAPIKMGAVAIAKQEAVLTKQMVSKLSKAYGSKVGREYATMMRAQNTYLKRLADIEELARAGKPTARAAQLAEDAERALIRTAKVFSEDIRYKPGFDSPMVAKMMSELPKELALNTRSAIESLKSTKVTIKTLEAEVARLESTLKAAQTKWPTDPSKWSDLMVDHAIKQSRLSAAKTGEVAELQRRLIALREAGKLEEAARIEVDLSRAIKSMEVEWGRGGAISRGKGGVAVAEPFAPIVGAPTIRRVTVPTELLPPAVAKIVPGAIIARIVVVTPDRRYTVPLPELISMSAEEIETKYGSKLNIYVEGAPREAVVEWTSPEVMVRTAQEVAIEVYTDVAISAAIEAATEAAARAATEAEIKIAAETAAETQIKAITETAIKTAVRTRVATRLKTALRLKLRIPISPLPAVMEVDEDERYPAGTIVWKQGAWWKIIPPPYNLLKPLSSKKPPVGVTVTRGTPQETLTFLEGKLPFKNVAFDLGVTDGYIDVANKIIVFGGYGLETDVGKRIPGPTKGITLEEAEVLGTRVPIRKRRVPKKQAKPSPGMIDIGRIEIL